MDSRLVWPVLGKNPTRNRHGNWLCGIWVVSQSGPLVATPFQMSRRFHGLAYVCLLESALEVLRPARLYCSFRQTRVLGFPLLILYSFDIMVNRRFFAVLGAWYTFEGREYPSRHHDPLHLWTGINVILVVCIQLYDCCISCNVGKKILSHYIISKTQL